MASLRSFSEWVIVVINGIYHIISQFWALLLRYKGDAAALFFLTATALSFVRAMRSLRQA